MAEEAYAWSPYRYAFDNPFKYIDPDGLFEDEAAARKHAEDNGIKIRPKNWLGKLFTSGSRHNLVENSDGTFALEQGKTSIQDLGGDLGVMESVKITPKDAIDAKLNEDGNTSTVTHRDGSTTETPLQYTGTAPLPNRVPGGQTWFSLTKGWQKGGTFVSKMKNYLKVKKVKGFPKSPKTSTSRGKEFNPKSPAGMRGNSSAHPGLPPAEVTGPHGNLLDVFKKVMKKMQKKKS